MDEMLVSPAGLDSTTDPADERISQPPAVEVSPAEVLISTQQVVFSTAAALGARRDSAGPPRRHYPKRYGFLENALMAREMERL
ncbi:hypothetical protein A5655_14455 [Mycobacterium sp. 1081908.1]|nr:hypothetical protein A5655_14455 [Mycobacterium sp. 1081908.1]